MAEKSKERPGVDIGIYSGGTADITNLNTFMGDSERLQVGFVANKQKTQQERNIFQGSDSKVVSEPSIQTPESSGPSSSGGTAVDLFAKFLEKGQSGDKVGSIAGTIHLSGKRTNEFYNSNGRAVAQVAGSSTIGVNGTEHNIYGEKGSSDNSKKLWQPSEEGYYELKKPSCALIINNIFNRDKPDPNYKKMYRKGAEGDTGKMRKLFNDLNFDYVLPKENVTSDRLKDILQNFRREIKDADYSSCFIIIMSHGGEAVNSILMDDMNDVDLYKHIVYEFSDHEDVRAIPKVFLVQACRDGDESPIRPVARNRPGNIQHVLVGHSTSPYDVAVRDPQTGAVYFEVLDQVFRENAASSPLSSLLYKVYNDERLVKYHQFSPVENFGFRDYKFQLRWQ